MESGRGRAKGVSPTDQHLRRRPITATLFVTAEYASRNALRVRELFRRGFDIGPLYLQPSESTVGTRPSACPPTRLREACANMSRSVASGRIAEMSICGTDPFDASTDSAVRLMRSPAAR